jgi:hypothetical protein
MVAGKTEKINGFQQIGFSTPVESGNAGNPSGKAVSNLLIIPELIQCYMAQEEHGVQINL